MKDNKRSKHLLCPTCNDTGVVYVGDDVVPCWNCDKGIIVIPDPVELAERNIAMLYTTDVAAGEWIEVGGA